MHMLLVLIRINMCYGCSLESSLQGDFNEYLQFALS